MKKGLLEKYSFNYVQNKTVFCNSSFLRIENLIREWYEMQRCA